MPHIHHSGPYIDTWRQLSIRCCKVFFPLLQTRSVLGLCIFWAVRIRALYVTGEMQSELQKTAGSIPDFCNVTFFFRVLHCADLVCMRPWKLVRWRDMIRSLGCSLRVRGTYRISLETAEILTMDQDTNFAKYAIIGFTEYEKFWSKMKKK